MRYRIRQQPAFRQTCKRYFCQAPCTLSLHVQSYSGQALLAIDYGHLENVPSSMLSIPCRYINNNAMNIEL